MGAIKGHVVSPETRQKIAQAHIKPQSKESKGYLYQYAPEHPYHTLHKYVAVHRLVAEQALGRYLKPEEQVHHINGDTRDNRVENLSLFDSNGHHYGFHVRKLTFEAAETMRDMYATGNYSQRQLARAWGASRRSIRYILAGVTYREEITQRSLA